MKKITVGSIAKLVSKGVMGGQVPTPFPGRRYPTRVAWQLFFRGKKSPLEYVGKPSPYRVREVWKHIHRRDFMDGWVAEFDRAGLLMYWSNNGLAHNQAWYAYHPNGNPDFFTTHTKPFFIKRIGGLTVYSTQKRLSQEMVDQYYAWYYKVFGKRLKRPKGEPLTGEAG